MTEGTINTHDLFAASAAVDNAMSRLMTQDEHDLVRKLGSLMSDFKFIMGEERSRDGDMREVCDHVHALQNMVLAQAAARAFPKAYRLLGGLVGE